MKEPVNLPKSLTDFATSRIAERLKYYDFIADLNYHTMWEPYEGYLIRTTDFLELIERVNLN